VVHTRRLPVGAERVWRALTSPDEQSAWIGARRAAASGREDAFFFTLEDEGRRSPEFRLDAAREGRSLEFAMRDSERYEPWRLRLELVPDGEGTLLRLTQGVANRALAPSVAAACEFYLDRLAAHLGGADPGVLEYDEYFVGQADHYRRMFPVQRRG